MICSSGAESPPDPLAFLITMAMVALFFYGVRESGKTTVVRIIHCFCVENWVHCGASLQIAYFVDTFVDTAVIVRLTWLLLIPSG